MEQVDPQSSSRRRSPVLPAALSQCVQKITKRVHLWRALTRVYDVPFWSLPTFVRDTDSDYVMRKPSRCWLGAVPRYWNVVTTPVKRCMWFPAARSLADLQIFCWKSSCRLLEYKQTIFGVVVLVFVCFFQPVCATLALFRFVSASFTLTTIAVGNTSEDFASVLSPWSIWALKNSSNGYYYTSRMHPWARLAKTSTSISTIWAQSRRTRISHSLCMC